MIIFVTVFFAGCAGSMLKVKRAVGGPDDIYIVDDKRELILHLDGMAGGEILGKIKRPGSFDEISVVVAESLKNELAKENIYTSRDDQIPTKTAHKGLAEVEVPDWSKRDYKTIISTVVTLSYFATSGPEGTPPYSYKLKGKTTLRISKYEGDKLKILMPTESGTVNLAFIEKDLEISTGQIAGLKSLMKILPPETILPELKEKTKQGVRLFVKEMKL
jgi:hypothetical protein